MALSIPVLIGISLFFTHGNLLTFSGINLSGVSALMSTFADSIRLICHLLDMFLVQGTSFALLVFWFGFVFAKNVFAYLNRYLNWIR
jgi:hypothetical protein